MSDNQLEHLVNDQKDINYKEIILKYLRYWPLYLAGIIISLLIAKVQLRYSENIYSSYTTIRILDDTKGAEIDLSGLPVGQNIFEQGINLDNESEILRSKRLLTEVVKELNMSTVYYSKGQVRTSELWGENRPFAIQWIDQDSNGYIPASPMYSVTFTSANTFTISTSTGFTKEDVKFGEIILHKNNSFRLLKLENENYERKAEAQIVFLFQYMPAFKRAAKLSKKLEISQLGVGSEILMLTLNGPNKLKNELILNTIVRKFDEDGQKDKRSVARRTEQFVNERLTYLVSELDSIESSLESFRQEHKIVSVENDASRYTARDENIYGKQQDINLQLLLGKELLSNIKSTQRDALIPSNIGIVNEAINRRIEEHNKLILARDNALEGRTEAHPDIRSLTIQIDVSFEQLVGELDRYIQGLNLKIAAENTSKRAAEVVLGTIPYKEKVLRNISRQQSIKENLYLYLLEKRESASLASAVTAPSMKVVDYAYTSPGPIFPKPKSKYLIAFFLGLLIPLSFVYIIILLDSKIHSKDDLSKMVMPFNIPIVGEVPQLPKTVAAVIGQNDRSELAEAFRVIRTNLNFLLTKKQFKYENCPIIVVTSSTKSEGKTFTSLNTAITLASSDKRVLLIGADLRNPQLHQYFDLDKNIPGLTTYLHNEDVDYHTLIQSNILGIDHLDALLSGFIPPNPAELLMNGRLGELLDQASKEYDVIIIDSAPTLLVTDTLLISEYVDATLYLVRSSVTEKKIVDHVIEVSNQNKLPHLGIILNGVGSTGSYGYGYKYKYNYGYGYAYNEQKTNKKWWKFWTS